LETTDSWEMACVSRTGRPADSAGTSETNDRTEAATVAALKKVASNRQAFRAPAHAALDMVRPNPTVDEKANRGLMTAEQGQEREFREACLFCHTRPVASS
jgi:hypothetical protein